MSTLGNLLRSIEVQGAGEEVRSKEGMAVAKLNESDRYKVRQLLGDNAGAFSNGANVYDSLVAGVGNLSVKAQPRLLLRDKNGKLVGEANLGGCPKLWEDLTKLFRRNFSTTSGPRIPSELRDKIASGNYPTSPEGKESPVEQIILDCFGAKSTSVHVDRRVKDKRLLFIGSREDSLSKVRALELAVESLDMFFRKVGTKWFLGASPGPPEVEARRRILNARRIRSAQLMQFFSDPANNQSSREDVQYDGTDLSLSRLTPDQKRLLAGVMTRCSSVDFESFQKALESGAVSVGCSLGFNVNYLVGGNQYGFFLSER